VEENVWEIEKTQGNTVVRKGNGTDHLSLDNGFGTAEAR
jgi:hypothetical protein